MTMQSCPHCGRLALWSISTFRTDQLPFGYRFTPHRATLGAGGWWCEAYALVMTAELNGREAALGRALTMSELRLYRPQDTAKGG